MLNALAMSPGQVIRTVEPGDGSTWTWYLVGADLLLHFETGDGGNIRAEASSAGPRAGRASMTQRQPFSPTQVWTLCVLAGLLPERSRG